jgi:SAM-dependent methyltransferase
VKASARDAWRTLPADPGADSQATLGHNALLVEAPNNLEFWNRAAATHQFTHALDCERFRLAVPRDAHILDYGCGQGRLVAELLELGYTHVLGVDSSPEMIRVASARIPGAAFLVNDGERLPCGDASVDAVLLFAVLTCIPSDETQKNLLREFKRILRPGGLLLMSDYPLQSDERNLRRYEQFAAELGGYGRFRLPDGAVLRHHPREWFDELLAAFHIERALEVDGLTMNGNPTRLLQCWARKT